VGSKSEIRTSLKTVVLFAVGVEESLRSISLLYVAVATHRYE
jgi:hypothetical protein